MEPPPGLPRWLLVRLCSVKPHHGIQLPRWLLARRKVSACLGAWLVAWLVARLVPRWLVVGLWRRFEGSACLGAWLVTWLVARLVPRWLVAWLCLGASLSGSASSPGSLARCHLVSRKRPVIPTVLRPDVECERCIFDSPRRHTMKHDSTPDRQSRRHLVSIDRGVSLEATMDLRAFDEDVASSP